MARGYPDYFGMSTFPNLGSWRHQYTQDDTIEDGEDANVFNLPFKGMVYGGYLEVKHNKVPAQLNFKVQVDGQESSWFTFELFKSYGIWGPDILPFYPITYDKTDDFGVIAFTKGITFEYEFILTIRNNTGAQSTNDGYVFYARIL